MVDLTKSWVRFRDLPEDIVEDLPEHVRIAFAGARLQNYDIELVCAGAKIPLTRRAPRRLVIMSDDGDEGEAAGPIAFDLNALAQDVRAATRVYVIGSAATTAVCEAAYAAAVADLASGSDVALIVETTQAFETPWVRTLTSLRTATGAIAAGTAA